MITRVVHRMERTDRLVSLEEEMFKLVDEYEIFPAENPTGMSSAMGSVHSHIEVLKGVEGNLLICEDDVCFLDENLTKSIFEKAFTELPEDWDMLYLGGNPKIPQIRYSDHLFRSEGGIHTNHAILYTQKAREFILNTFDYRTNEIATYDHWLFMIGQKLMNVFIISPMIAWQKPGFSDCRGSYQDYYLHIRSNEIRHL